MGQNNTQYSWCARRGKSICFALPDTLRRSRFCRFCFGGPSSDMSRKTDKDTRVEIPWPWYKCQNSPKCPKVLTERARSYLGSSGRESQKSLSHRPNPVSRRGKLPKKGFRKCKGLFWESHPRGPKTPFAPSLSTFGHFWLF